MKKFMDLKEADESGFFHFETISSTTQIHSQDFNFIKLLSLLK